MKDIRLIMGMPIEIEIVGTDVEDVLEKAFAYLSAVEEQFSVYKETSEISHLNRHSHILENVGMSEEMQEVFEIAEKTKKETNGYFDIRKPDGSIDPSGIVKGWAILNTAKLIRDAGYENYFVNAGGDIAMGGTNAKGRPWSRPWSVGIRNPFTINEIVKVVFPRGKGIAMMTSSFKAYTKS